MHRPEPVLGISRISTRNVITSLVEQKRLQYFRSLPSLGQSKHLLRTFGQHRNQPVTGAQKITTEGSNSTSYRLLQTKTPHEQNRLCRRGIVVYVRGHNVPQHSGNVFRYHHKHDQLLSTLQSSVS